MSRASGTAEKIITIFHSVANDLSSACRANRCKKTYRAFKTIKGIGLIIHYDFKCSVVSISAFVTSFHNYSLDFYRMQDSGKILK